MARFINPVPQFLDGAGNPLISGKLFFFESGTNTPKETFADVNKEVPNTHPVILNGDGTTPNIFFDGAAKVIATDSDDVQKWSRDPVTAGGDAGTVGDDWNAISIYSINSVVDLDGVFYVSIINNNQNNNPGTTATAWTRWDLLKRWNTNETYRTGDPVTLNGAYYASVIDNNLGNDPFTDDGTNWSSNRVIATTVTASNPTFTPNPLTRSIKFTLVGGGGGGGAFIDGQGANTSVASEGGSGAGARIVITDIVDSTYALVIGTGGAAGASGANNGFVGGITTVISVTLTETATGGLGGNGGLGSANSFKPGANGGGSGSGMGYGINGTSSSCAGVVEEKRASSSTSGHSPIFGGGVLSMLGGGPGIDATRPGEGGGGVIESDQTNNRVGGSGFRGEILIEEYLL